MAIGGPNHISLVKIKLKFWRRRDGTKTFANLSYEFISNCRDTFPFESNLLYLRISILLSCSIVTSDIVE